MPNNTPLLLPGPGSCVCVDGAGRLCTIDITYIFRIADADQVYSLYGGHAKGICKNGRDL